MNKKVISSEEFVDRFVECLKEGRDFCLIDVIVDGDITSEMIKRKLKKMD